MITFSLSLIALIIGYFFYGRFVERVFGPDDRVTPAVAKADGVDFMVLPSWKVFMIQFLNIAGTGPIFGAIMGAMYGPAAYLWIVFGCIFAGSVHDYFSGMLSMRHDGANQPEIIGSYLGNTTKQIMLVFTVFLLMMVGAVFVFSPAKILGDMWEPAAIVESAGQYTFWIVVIFIYYIIATMLPIDKIIGKIYPLFAFSLLFMAAALTIVLFVKWPSIPEIWEGLSVEAMTPKNIFPCLFITIACGAISGFHATQSPLMARCLKNESMVAGGQDVVKDAPSIVNLICNDWLGVFGGILALLGVVAAPITSGDTALRSCRLIIADFVGLEQKTIRKRLYICIPLFAAVIALLIWQMSDKEGFGKIWSWFGWSNQTLSVFMLWAVTVYLVRQKKPYFITLIPAIFMTVVCTTFLLSEQIFHLSETFSYTIGGICLVIACIWFAVWYKKETNKQ